MLSTKIIVSLAVVSILVLTVGAVNQTNTSENNSITPISTTTVTPTMIQSYETVTPNATDTVSPIETLTLVNETNTQNQIENITTPISTEEKNRAINIAINFTINNIGIYNPKVVDVTRRGKNLRARVRDDETGENIVLIITTQGIANEEIPVVPVFTETRDNFSGNHVSFQFTNNSILNYTLDGKLIFESINLGFNSTKVRRTGATLRISDATDTVIIYDNANGIIAESASGKIESTYTVVPEINGEETGDRVNLLDNNIKGSILGSDPNSVVVLAAGNIISEKINHGKTTFTANVLGVRSTKEYEFEDRVVEGIYNKRIGNIVNIDNENSHNIVGFGVDTTVNSVTHNTVSINASSDTPEGRTVVLRVGKDIFPNLNLRILVDGNEVNQAKDFDDLFKNDKYTYLTVIGQNVEVLVSIPAFSEHEIVVTSEAPTANVTVAAVTNTVIPGAITTTNTVTPEVTMISNTNIPPPTSNPPSSPGVTIGVALVAVAIAAFLLIRKK
jgi:hypothetical protein